MRELDGIGNIVADLGHEGYTKYLGSRFVLDYASKLDDALIAAKKIAFEVPETFSFGGKEVDRFYDMVVEEAGKTVKKELKATDSSRRQVEFVPCYMVVPSYLSIWKVIF